MSDTTQIEVEDEVLSRREREARKEIRVIGDPVLRERGAGGHGRSTAACASWPSG